VAGKAGWHGAVRESFPLDCESITVLIQFAGLAISETALRSE
jgi:hypothetical protein